MNSTMEPPAAPVVSNPQERVRAAFAGVLLGTAVGDSLGLPMEGLSAARQRKLFPVPLRQRFVGGWGMVSDDTEHTFLVAQSLLDAPNDPAIFQRHLARRLRWWLVCLPAGVGLATLRATLRLWLGVSPQRSGVWSAGNGPAMRSAVLGVFFADHPERRRAFVRASTELTHRDPRAEIAAAAVAETAAWMTRPDPDFEELFQTLTRLADLPEWTSLVTQMRGSLTAGRAVADFARDIGAKSGVSGYALQSVPVAIYAALRHRDDFGEAVSEAISCGGDTDTVGAIVGAFVGARVGLGGIPAAWRAGIVEFPLSPALLQHVAERLQRQTEQREPIEAVHYAWPVAPLRNAAFLGLVLWHGLRRALPPY
jgi:ADP-ribosylglycohydrolase